MSLRPPRYACADIPGRLCKRVRQALLILRTLDLTDGTSTDIARHLAPTDSGANACGPRAQGTRRVVHLGS
jgi:hypothetical protein